MQKFNHSLNSISKMIRKILVVAAGVFLIVFSFFVMRYLSEQSQMPQQKKVKQAKIYVKAEPVKYKQTETEIQGEGRLISGAYVDLISEVQGKILPGNIPLKKGQNFKKGDLLIKIYDKEARLALKSKVSRFMNSIATILPDLKIDYKNSYKPWEIFFEELNIDEELPELPKINSRQEKIFLASRNILSDYYAIKSDEIRLKKHNIYAPFTGSYIEVILETGSVANPGTRIAKIIRTDRLELEVPIEVDDVDWLKKGSVVWVKNRDSSKTWKGRVIRIAGFVNETTQAVSVFVTLTPNSNNPVYKGMYLEAIFPGKVVKEIMKLPRNAVFNNNEVFIVEDGVLQKREINIVKINEETLLFNGLAENTMIVTEPLVNISENTDVEILD